MGSYSAKTSPIRLSKEKEIELKKKVKLEIDRMEDKRSFIDKLNVTMNVDKKKKDLTWNEHRFAD